MARLLWLFLLFGLTASCNSLSRDRFGNLELADDAIYLRDAQGQCLRVPRTFTVSGDQFMQSGYLRVFVVPADQPCHPQSEAR